MWCLYKKGNDYFRKDNIVKLNYNDLNASPIVCQLYVINAHQPLTLTFTGRTELFEFMNGTNRVD